MNGDELFDGFPDLFFRCLRERMLLGMAPAETVRAILDPLLVDFHTLMPELPLELQADCENILRIYPEIAAQCGIQLRPPLVESFSLLLQYLAGARSGQAGRDIGLAMAAEPQKTFESPKESLKREGRGFLYTDRGNCVLLEFSYTAGDRYIYFSTRPLKFGIDIFVCGKYALSLEPGGVAANLDIEKPADLAAEGFAPRESIRVFETGSK